jgi:ABC-type Mn2+/Zn2+ transport system permease subunit
MDALFTPFQYEFFRNGTIAAVLVGGLCGLVGVYIVLRGMSFIGHGLSHAVFGGAVVAFILQFNFYVGAVSWGFVAALLINQTVRKTTISADAAIGVVTTASFALGVALISRYRRFTQSFDAALFGNILGVTFADVAVIIGVTVVAALLIFFFYKQLLFTTFNTEVAQVFGVSTFWIETWFALVLAAAIIASVQIIGVTMIGAALVIPPITVRLLTDSFHRLILFSTGLGALTGLVGMYLSFYVDVSSGATIVLLQAIVFCVALLYVSRVRNRRRLVETTVYGPT